MGRADIHFFSDGVDFRLPNKQQARAWINQAIADEGKKTADLNFIFCTDAYLIDMNRQYLNHDTYTDIITFDNSDDPQRISGDIFISIERVRENAEKLGVDSSDELDRVMIHGVLHLLGYKDKSAADKQQMRAKEDFYILKKRNTQR